MPTDRPEPYVTPTNPQELLMQSGASAFIVSLMQAIGNYAYYTRSHMPGGGDYTDFTKALEQVIQFCRERPDWTAACVSDSLSRYMPHHETSLRVLKLQETIDSFEEETGVKLEPFPYTNSSIKTIIKDIAKRGGPINYAGEAKHELEKLVSTLQGIIRVAEASAKSCTELMEQYKSKDDKSVSGD
jgi:hypothetical protein